MSSNGDPLLADFGRSKVVGSSGYTTEFACVWRYLAPEIVDDAASPSSDDDSKSQPATTKETDIWAFGLVGVEVRGYSSQIKRKRRLSLETPPQGARRRSCLPQAEAAH